MNELHARSAYIYDGWGVVGTLIDGSKGRITSMADAVIRSRSRLHSAPAKKLPADPERMNGKRAAWADLAVTAFQAATGTDEEDALGDLLADLMHWADRANYDFELAFNRAQDHYAAETGEGDGQ
ncbi:hypothetical protein Pan44_19050 [Caulifigura coniformis]|uniref:Uncharacterized protein n=1 Tax=Caulifigura coniformis TaxID=2527983 RepID=A0A517SCM5_9PLAN|nr:hypothetical protein [Caulifigura coniformis]QDT53879.1 hypothetical protein Pan44_19050 [Caulifigura coniformis]